MYGYLLILYMETRGTIQSFLKTFYFERCDRFAKSGRITKLIKNSRPAFRNAARAVKTASRKRYTAKITGSTQRRRRSKTTASIKRQRCCQPSAKYATGKNAIKKIHGQIKKRGDGLWTT